MSNQRSLLGEFDVIVADCPWKFGDKLPGHGRGAEKHYDCMTVKELCAFELPPIASDAWLIFWRVGSMQAEALQIIKAWGFKAPTSEFIWVKTTKAGKPRMGMGRSVRNCHEVALICKRGKPTRHSTSVPSVIFAPRGEHSEKPQAFYEAVELLTGPGLARAEMFSRRRRKGWTAFGNEVDKFKAAP
jgi:N6-adenosine-specific RNA methylase IME4